MKSDRSDPLTIRARTFTLPLRVEDFLVADTPGNVGVALCGGGSRAMCAGMGQLRGLDALQVNGRSALSQVKAICAVSGGSWLAVPYTFLSGDTSDEDFLGPLVPPEQLRPVKAPGIPRDHCLAWLRDGNIGRVAASPGFHPAPWTLQVIDQGERLGVPDRMAWQTLVSSHLLTPYGLYDGWQEAAGEPPSLAAHSMNQLQRDVLADNPALADLPVHLYADQRDPTRARRPFLICQGAMMVERPEQEMRALAEVLMTPFFCGIMGQPEGVDANGEAPGGGAVQPFGFAGVVQERDAAGLTVEVARPFTLYDMMGVSSAFLAEPIRNLRGRLLEDPEIRESVQGGVPDAPSWFTPQLRQHLEQQWEELAADAVEGAADTRAVTTVSGSEALVAAYNYVGPHTTPGGAARTDFADGGVLDNTGVTSLLVFEDIDHIVAFQNTFEPLAEAALGVLDADGAEIPHSRIFVSGQLPPLFGYQPYREGIGYRLYAGDPEPVKPERGHHQVFESSAFVSLLQALWRSSGEGAFSQPATARLALRVLANPSLGVRGRGGEGDANPEPVTLVVCYLGRVQAWYERLHPSVRRIHGAFDDLTTCDGFPCYSTIHINLDPVRVNLLAHLAAWCVTDSDQTDVIRALFAP
ncbi:MAG: hypothetical protein H6739_35105 [Alphaproteobacteria bacterium]|nr:hypothetical protein [Alphaproteobacteria bacterium]